MSGPRKPRAPKPLAQDLFNPPEGQQRSRGKLLRLGLDNLGFLSGITDAQIDVFDPHEPWQLVHGVMQGKFGSRSNVHARVSVVCRMGDALGRELHGTERTLDAVTTAMLDVRRPVNGPWRVLKVSRNSVYDGQRSMDFVLDGYFDVEVKSTSNGQVVKMTSPSRAVSTLCAEGLHTDDIVEGMPAFIWCDRLERTFPGRVTRIVRGEVDGHVDAVGIRLEGPWPKWGGLQAFEPQWGKGLNMPVAAVSGDRIDDTLLYFTRGTGDASVHFTCTAFGYAGGREWRLKVGNFNPGDRRADAGSGVLDPYEEAVVESCPACGRRVEGRADHDIDPRWIPDGGPPVSCVGWGTAHHLRDAPETDEGAAYDSSEDGL